MTHDDSRRAELDILRRAVERFGFLVDSIPTIVWTASPRGEQDWANLRWYEFNGLDRATAGPEPWRAICHPEDVALTDRLWQRALATGEPYTCLHRIRRHDGEYRWTLTNAVPERDGSGEIVRWIGAGTDITDLRRAEDALRESEARLRSLAEAIPQLVWTTDASGEIDYVNRRWVERTGQALAQMRQGGWLGMVHPEDSQAVERIWRGAQERDHYEVEYRLRDRDGQYRWVLARAVALRDPARPGVRWFGTCTDIEDQKQAIARRDEFVSIASHELRTPLASLKLQAQSMRRQLARTRSVPPDKLETFVDRCEQQVDRLTRLVDDMLDFTRLSTGRLQIEESPTDLGALVAGVLDRFAPELRKARCAVSTSIAPGVVGSWDGFRIEQVVANLLSNAVKYGGGRPLYVEVGADDGHARLVVQDQGAGIAPEDQERIFEQFERAVAPSRVTGLGLGLFISRKLVRAHGGELTVESAAGHGARFVVSLPLTEPAAAVAAAE